MKAIKKNFWLKVALGILSLVVFLAPVKLNLSGVGNIVALNKSFALITSLDISPITEANITAGSPGSVKISVQVTGQPDPNEHLKYQILEYGYAGSKEEHELAIDYTASVKTYNYVIPFTIKADEEYLVSVYTVLIPDTQDYVMIKSNGVAFSGDGANVNNNTAYGLSSIPEKPVFDLGCGVTTIFTNCLVAGLYYIVYEPLSSITTLSAKFLDFFVYYSISSDAYRSGFVEKAWSVVRDISNMFFIIALLYIAIKTILGMNVSAQQRLIGYIIMVALVINFSLFVSRVVIDASNILARVFYNNITPYDENGTAIPLDSNKPKSISVGLVRTFDPQKVISNPKENLGNFALVTILFIILLGYMVLMFISIAMLFLGRVAGLWIAMMFSPLAFTSLALPFKIPKFSFDKWSTDLFKLSFMAPIFAFFLYIIILFGGFLSQIQYDSGNTASSLTGWLDALMKNIIPFILIFVLIKEAKTITKDYAGDMGTAFSNYGAMVGGLAVGAATGGLAMAGRATAGRAGSWLARNTSKDNFAGRAVNRLGRRMGTASWDARNAKIPIINKGLSDTGLKNLNTVSTPKAGGWEKIREDKKQKRFKRAEEVSKVGYGERVSVNLRRAELDLHTLMEGNEEKLASLEKNVEEARKNLRDATASNDTGKINMYTRQIQAFRAHQVAIKKGEKINMGYNDLDDKGAVVTKNIKEDYGNLKVKDGANRGKTIVQLQTEVLPEAKKAVRDTIKKRKLAYADRLSMRFWSDGAQEVVQKVRAGATYENKTA
ncbi:MAG: hypothetical protein KGZ39_01435 [Simkania sp.]|nr:hypothetical protein [Simkania sp.]